MGSIRFTEDDLTQANRANVRLWLCRWQFVFWACAALIGIALLLTDTARDGARGVASSVLGLAFIVSLWLSVTLVTGTRRVAVRHLRETAALREPVSYTWDPLRFRAVSRNGETDMVWGDFHAWHRYPGGYLLFPSSLLSFAVPDRVFGDDAPEAVLIAGLADAGVPERRRFRRLKRRAG